MLNLLLVEDDEFFLEAVAAALVEKGWRVTTAADGIQAKEILAKSPRFDAIISDIQMPRMNGVDLLAWVKVHRPTPFILMTGFALVMETKKALELGADDFLAKPFESEELIETVKRVSAVRKQVSNDNFEYCKVSLEEFVSTKTLSSDVFVKLGNRYVRIGRRGDAIPLERIQSYGEKGLKFLYVRKEDFRKIVDFNLALARTVMSSKNVDQQKKSNFMRYTGEVLLEKAFVTGVDETAFTESKEFLTVSMDILADDRDALELLESFNSHADYLYAHSLCVSIYSVIIAKEMGWTSTANLFKLSLAGLFHDIGKKEIPRELLERPRALLKVPERALIETHVSRGREILLAVKTIPSEAVAVAFEHHEDNLGMGYPRRLTKHEIHPFTQIVRVANHFANFAIKSAQHPGMDFGAALSHIDTHYREGISAEAYLALCRVNKNKLKAVG